MKAKLQMLLAKNEATYNVDPVPTAAANWLAVQNIDVNPVEMETDDQATASNTFGQDEKIVGAVWSTISFEMPLRGGGMPLGSASTVPNFDPVLRCCGMARVLTNAVSCVYSPIDTLDESATFYYYLDQVMQRMTGVRGSWELKFNAKKQALLAFKGMGLRNPMVDASIPVPTEPTMPRPMACNKANTQVTFGALTALLSSFSINQNNDVQYRNLTGREDVSIIDRNTSGSISIELPTVAQKNFLGTGGVMSEALTDSLTIVHGTTAGNIVTVAVPKAQLFKPKLSNEQGAAMLSGELHVVRNKLTLTFT
ncbi:hypothetical protein [Paucibacter sp. Y2R2-4]|uniref:hypothetical protein n=1 Tax=Paucibacter sp. Y2R2-4 TaxID=2893553 RepID=UPI0021E41F8C|nr:hypothetical protein [Paucibacter sp. Y2R2-4]MCV2349340.1 hypothetical protein [Paucibacter sp. Y2R2-4]